MRRLLAAIAFLSRLPLPRSLVFDGSDVARASLFFPVVGALLGGIEALAIYALRPHLPPALTAVIALALGALTTGALHLDGLADTADGFGGGRTREDVLRIMRDHAIGAYGAIALVLVIAFQIFAVAALISGPAGSAERALVVAGALGRFVSVPLSRTLPYARAEGGLGAALTGRIGALELVLATLFAGAIAVGLGGARGAISFGAVLALTLVNGLLFRRKIGGVTGDTLGANTVLCEALVLLVWVAR